MKKLIYQLSVVWCLALACIVCVGADTPTKKSDPAPTSITDLLSQVAADKTANDNIVVSIAADQKAIADAQAKLAADTKTQADTQSKMAADVAALIAAIQQDPLDFSLLRARARSAADAMLGDVASWRLSAESRGLAVPG